MENERGNIHGRVLDIGADHTPFKRMFKECEWVHAEGDIHQLDYEDASFDCAICLDVLQYAMNPGLVMLEMCRVLKEEGFFCAAAPGTSRDDATALWDFKIQGMAGLAAMLPLEVKQVAPVQSQQGGLIHGYMKDYLASIQRGLTPELQKWVEEMDKRFPVMVAITGVKREGTQDTGEAVPADRAATEGS
jgi:ubiquinone/menaquinone biosynthesis C-methylase UbiE